MSPHLETQAQARRPLYHPPPRHQLPGGGGGLALSLSPTLSGSLRFMQVGSGGYREEAPGLSGPGSNPNSAASK